MISVGQKVNSLNLKTQINVRTEVMFIQYECIALNSVYHVQMCVFTAQADYDHKADPECFYLNIEVCTFI